MLLVIFVGPVACTISGFMQIQNGRGIVNLIQYLLWFLMNDDLEENQFMHGMLVVCVLLFFSFYDPKLHAELPCALVNWFILVTEDTDPSTGMQVLKPEVLGQRPVLEVIHLDAIV